jgi:hypothetical protein
MPFIGNQPALSYTSFAKQDFTTSATTSYTLDNPVANANELALFINFVRQEPTTAYSASGTSLTLTSATSASDDMYCVFLGKAVQTVNPPNGSVDSSKINYPLTTFSSTGIDDNATSTAITIDSSENVGIGTASPAATLDVNGGLNCGFLQSNSSIYATSGIFRSSDGTASAPSIQPGVDNDTGFFRPATNTIGFSTAGTEHMRLDDSGDLTLGATLTEVQPGLGNNTQAISLRGGTTEQFFISSAASPMFVNRTADGGLIQFYSAGNNEGSINVNGSTVTYNGFTGTHWSRFTDNSTPNILKGTVLETLDEMCDWYNLEFDVTDEEGNTYTQRVPHVLEDGQSVGDTVAHTYEGTDYQATIVKETDIKHVKSKVSDTVDAKNVYGVFIDYDNDEDGYNDFYVASVGSYVVRIKANETIAKGDLLQSNGDGTAKVQTDDNVKSSSFAKVLSTTIIETYEDGSFIVPCSLMC